MFMKAKRFLTGIIAALPLLTACVDDNYQNIVKAGDPQINAGQPQTTLMGDSLTLNVACSDAKGTALSTLKAELCFSGEVVEAKTIRTKDAGDYQVRLLVPFMRYVPNGDAVVRLTLQNVTTSTTIVDVNVPVERPHFGNMQFVTADGTVYPMTEVGDYNYTTTMDITDNAFKGHFLTADGSYVFGYDGGDIALGGEGMLSFQSAEKGKITVSLNTCDYTYAPQEELAIKPLVFTAADNTFTGTLVQGDMYKFTGSPAVNSEEWFYDTDWWENNYDGTYTFKAITGTYTVKADFDNGGFRIWTMNGDKSASLNTADGTGAVWLIGDKTVGKPSYTASTCQGWWTGEDYDYCLAPVAPQVHQITLTIGKQLDPSNVNFKFFGQANWGTEFGKDGSATYLTCESDVFIVDPNDGNIHLKDGASVNDGEIYIFTVDLTGGCAPGKLIVTKGKSGNVTELDLSSGDAQIATIRKGGQVVLSGIDDSYFVDPDFLAKNADGTYTFLAINGDYALRAYSNYGYVQVYPVNEEGKPATLTSDGTGGLWAIGGDCICKPSLSSANNAGWNTDLDKVFALAPIAPKKFQITLVAGQQLKVDDANFKFFGQPGWGVEFKGSASDYTLSTESDVIGVGDGNGHDDGNLYLRDGVTLEEGATYVFTVDITAGVKNAVLTVKKK